MARLSLLGLKTALAAPLAAGDINVPLVFTSQAEMGRVDLELNGDPIIADCLPDQTNSTVLVLSHPAGIEVVEVIVNQGTPYVLARGLNGTNAINHPTGTCVMFSGLPDTPCDTVEGLCASDPARAALVECLAPELIQKFRTDPALPLAIVEGICGTQSLQDALGACLHNEVVAATIANSTTLQNLITAVAANISLANQAVLANNLVDEIVNGIGGVQELQNRLANFIAMEVVTGIGNEPAALAALRVLTNQGMTAAAIVGTICNDPNWRQALANCIALNLTGSYAGDATARDAMRVAIVSIIGGTGLFQNGVGQIGFNYSSPHMVNAICADAGGRAALANCLRPHLNIPPAANGALLQLDYQCLFTSVGSAGPPPRITVRIPDSGASAGNIGNMTCLGTAGWPNLTYQPVSIVALGDGSKIVAFDSSQYITPETSGIGVFRVEANGIIYSGFLTIKPCAIVDGGGG